jgi:hypothetical protein
VLAHWEPDFPELTYSVPTDPVYIQPPVNQKWLSTKVSVKNGSVLSQYLIRTLNLKDILYHFIKHRNKRVCSKIYVSGNNFSWLNQYILLKLSNYYGRIYLQTTTCERCNNRRIQANGQRALWHSGREETSLMFLYCTFRVHCIQISPYYCNPVYVKMSKSYSLHESSSLLFEMRIGLISLQHSKIIFRWGNRNTAPLSTGPLSNYCIGCSNSVICKTALDVHINFCLSRSRISRQICLHVNLFFFGTDVRKHLPW